MTHPKTTAFCAGAQQSCACPTPAEDTAMGTVQQQPDFRPVTRRDLMAAVNTIARDLGLRPGSVMVVDALLSCLPCKDATAGLDAPITPRTLLTVYAANSTLCFRAKGITDRQLRRHLERLEELGLIQRRDSANGKRFPIHQGGKVVGAFGIDISPLLARSAEFLNLARIRREEEEELRGLKSRIQTLRARCRNLVLDEDSQCFVETLHNTLRRVGTTLAEARALLARLAALLDRPEEMAATQDQPASARPAATAETSDTDGQNVRHIETLKSDTKNAAQNETFHRLWSSMTTLREFYPDMPRNDHAVSRIIFDFGRALGVAHDTLAEAIARLGLFRTLQVQDRMAASAMTIRNPEGYLRQILRDQAPKVGHGQLVPATG